MIIGTICSHSALQIFHGAKQEGFRTFGLTLTERRHVYEHFPLSAPDELVELDFFRQILDESVQQSLIENNVVLVPHGSFVEYVGADNILTKLQVPVFGNKKSLEWESSRHKVDEWMRLAGLKVPEYKEPNEIDGLCIVKTGGAKGGLGFFLVSSEEEFYEKLGNSKNVVVQEYVVGVRYYPHFFYSPLEDRVELLSIDQRLESNVDGLHRVQTKLEPSYTVTGNAPVVLRESLLPEVLSMGERVVEASKELFEPGIIGPFCVETICTPDLEFYAFEISARIVAGTNLYPSGSQYSCYYFNEPMSTGRRIARELKNAEEKAAVEDLVS